MLMVTIYVMGSAIGKSTIGKFIFDLSDNVIFCYKIVT
jgi:hypothetical protein